MSHYRPYPAYKDSGVGWLGQVPEHWDVKRLKYNLRHISEKTDRRERMVALENIESWTGRFIETDTKFEGDGLAFEASDILFGKLRPYLAKAYLASSPGEAVGDVFVIRPSLKICPAFAQYQVLSREFISTVDGSTYGAKMPRVSWDFFGDMPLPTPSIEEQKVIAAHLDRETARIDGLVAKKTRFIELLREKRQALITQAVTKGLDPNVKMKDSGVEWLGDVPEHWNVKRLKYNLRHVSEKTDRRERAVALENIESWTGRFIETDTEFEGEGVAFEVGDILFGKLRPYLAKVYLTSSRGEAVGDVFVLRPSSNIFPEFAQYQILSREFINRVDGSTYGAKMPRVSWEFFGDMPLTIPSKTEQQAITAYLDRETTRIDALISKTERSIELLKERRSALITAAVTGQIDLREAV